MVGGDGREGEDGRRGNLGGCQVETACTWSLAELEMNLEEIVMKVTSMMENQDLHMMNTRIYLKRKFDCRLSLKRILYSPWISFRGVCFY